MFNCQAKIKKIVKKVCGIFFFGFLFFSTSKQNCLAAVSLYFSPAQGVFTQGSTFETSLFLNTEGESINVIDAEILFPPDKIQLISPSVDQKSIIDFWIEQPGVDNHSGKIKFLGGVLNGVNTKSGLISKLSFRVKGTGSAFLKFSDSSKILANDGKGSKVSVDFSGALYDLILAPPNGPEVVSSSHPDQGLWFANRDVSLSWFNSDGDNKVEGYSYLISDDPLENPDNVVDEKRGSVFYKDLDDGKHFFHIKTLRDGVWGGTTHYSLNIDKSSPAEFSVDAPDFIAKNNQLVVKFFATDKFSGIDHYEMRIIPLRERDFLSPDQNFFEVQSPYIFSNLDVGEYELEVRCYDKAGNYSSSRKTITVNNSPLNFISTSLFNYHYNYPIEKKSENLIYYFLIFGIIFSPFLIRRCLFCREKMVSQKTFFSFLREKMKNIFK